MVSTLDVAPLTVVSYNIHKGIRFSLGGNALSAIAEQLQAQQADVIFLQEAADSGRQAQWLAQRLHYHLHYLHTAKRHGNAVLTRQRAHHCGQVNLTLHRMEKRGLLHCQIDWQGHAVHLCTTHLNLREGDRQRQLRSIIDYLAYIPDAEACILGGDFNDWRGRLCQPLAQHSAMHDAHSSVHGVYAKTFPALAPLLPLDRLYSRNLVATGAGVFLKGRWHASDHAPLRAVFTLSENCQPHHKQ